MQRTLVTSGYAFDTSSIIVNFTRFPFPQGADGGRPTPVGQLLLALRLYFRRLLKNAPRWQLLPEQTSRFELLTDSRKMFLAHPSTINVELQPFTVHLRFLSRQDTTQPAENGLQSHCEIPPEAVFMFV